MSKKDKTQDSAVENRLTKENVWVYLLNYSKTQWLDSRYFHSHLVQDIDFSTPEGIVALEKTQRELAIIINILIQDLILLKDERIIVTSSKGYKIAVSPEEFEEAIDFTYKKIKDPLIKINWWKEGLNNMIHKNSDRTTKDMFYG